MGSKYPPLNQSEVEKILKKAGFYLKRTKGGHSHWEGYIKEKTTSKTEMVQEGKRRIVTVKKLKSKTDVYSNELLNSMIRQSGLTKDEFYSFI